MAGGDADARLRAAARAGDTPGALAALAAGADINIRIGWVSVCCARCRGRAVLRGACWRGHCIVLPPGSQAQLIALHWASANGHASTAEALIAHGADVRAANRVSRAWCVSVSAAGHVTLSVMPMVREGGCGLWCCRGAGA